MEGGAVATLLRGIGIHFAESSKKNTAIIRQRCFVPQVTVLHF